MKTLAERIRNQDVAGTETYGSLGLVRCWTVSPPVRNVAIGALATAWSISSPEWALSHVRHMRTTPSVRLLFYFWLLLHGNFREISDTTVQRIVRRLRRFGREK